MQCPKCAALSDSNDECSSCGIIFSRYNEIQQSSVIARANQSDGLIEDSASQSQWICENIWEWLMPLVILILGIVMQHVGPGKSAIGSLRMWLHELGHTFTYWFSGIWAMPSFQLTTSYHVMPSWFVFIFVVVMFGVAAYAFYQRHCYFAALSFGLCVLASCVMFLFLSRHTTKEMAIYMGEGGMFVLSAWSIMAFFYRFPEEFNWHKYRYILSAPAVLVFYQSYISWQAVRAGQADGPFGGMILPNGQALMSDQSTLVQNFGWTEGRIMDSYVAFANVCLAILVINYLVCGWMLYVRSKSKTEV